ncbi:zinc finger protein 414 [Synchiropus splendidus]|uniref:zinc finger protein 414 n=1 Tax=Synchiropus splendidus TaxID=270530 RepID=UPI00237E0718|nr:zinc finger protein 414 [Synchiropus splendidus]
MSSEGPVIRTQEAAPVPGNLRLCCPIYGCRRVYNDQAALEVHIKDHQIPAQSVPGKVLQCSTVGCSCSFPDMQSLMLHTRHHHKPNIYFLCESCRTKLRSYRGLLTHLHTCSKVSRSKAKAAEAAAAQQSASSSSAPTTEAAPPVVSPVTGAVGPQPEPLVALPPTTDMAQQFSAELTPDPASQRPHTLSSLLPPSPPPLPEVDDPVGPPLLTQAPESALSLPPSSSAHMRTQNQS